MRTYTLQLKSWKTKRLSLSIHPEESASSAENSFNISLGSAFSDDYKRDFYILIEVELTNEEYLLSVEQVFRFETDQDIDEAFKESDFVKVNAPAIAFPYLRSYISSLTLQSGLAPVMLPSINFVELVKKTPIETTEGFSFEE